MPSSNAKKQEARKQNIQRALRNLKGSLLTFGVPRRRWQMTRPYPVLLHSLHEVLRGPGSVHKPQLKFDGM